MRPVTVEHVVSQYFAQMPTAGVRGDIKAVGTVAYYVALYGNYQPHGHAGMDFKCPIGTPIYAMADGTVLYAGWSEDLPGAGDVRKWLLYYNFGGIITVIQHDGWVSITAHQSTNDAVHVGMKVSRGQIIGLSGDTKTRTTKVAPHVHVEALVDLSYKTGGGLIYGRTDPSRFFGSAAIAPQGTITPISEQGFLMALNDDQQQKLYDDIQNIKGYLYAGGPSVKGEEGDPASVFGRLINIKEDTRDVRLALTSFIPEMRGKQDGSVNVPELAKALAGQLAAADVQALAAQLQITVKEN